MNPLGKISGQLVTMLSMLCLVASGAWAQQVSASADAGSSPKNSIDALQVSQQGGITVVKLTLKQPLAAQPASFSIANPARIAFDFPSTGNGLGRNSQQVNEGDIRSINIVQVGDRTRLVLNLHQLNNYETRIEGATMLINFAPKTAVAPSAAPAVVHFAEVKPQATAQNVRDINFRRGRNGEARITVDLSDPNVGIDIRQQGQNLIVDFKKTNLPESLNRRLDVTDFATPVTSIMTQPQGENVRMLITPHGQWEHNAYQSDNQFVIEVRPVIENLNKLVQGVGAQGEKLSLNFQNIEVRSVLQVIADFTNFNIITSDTVGGNVTLRLKDVPWDQALDIILQAKGLGMRKTGNVIWIAPQDEIAKRDDEQAKSRQASTTSEPIRMETFQLNYAKAEEVIKLVTGEQTKGAAASAAPAGAGGPASPATPAPATGERGSYLSLSGVVTVDARTNQLFVTDYPAYLERVRKLIALIDKPVKQVLIEARVVSAEDNFGRSLGVRLGYNDLSSTVPGFGLGNRVPGTSTYSLVGGSLEGVFGATGQTTGGGRASGSAPSLGQSNMVNLPASIQGGAAPSTFAVSLFKSGLASFLNLELQAAETDGRVKGIASPRVVTADGKLAIISQGVDIPYTSLTTTGTPVTSFKKAVLQLSVTPQITAEGSVILDLDVSQDTVGAIYTSGVSINTKNIKTRVSVESGGTVVLGGIFEQNEEETTNKVPLLGDIPMVGGLFRSNTRTQSRKELLVFITPRVINEQIQAGVR
ncbi:MAG: type IV pilus secretin family protein [Rhodocyclaceae bacterium]|nr:MAG: type IV pilus secretin family protein [Rhodocyclaceae bacterium]